MAIWDFAGRIANFGVVFGVGVILTRLLAPAEFGTFAIAVAVISFSAIFVDLGFRSAIIQAREVTQEQLSTIFYLNLAAAVGLFGIFFFTAGIVERFYEIAGLQKYIVAASGLFIINALALIPGGLLQKNLEFKKISVISTAAAAFSGSLSLYLAFSGFGVWALVIQQLISAGLIFLGVSFYAKWLPSFKFDLVSIKELWRYGVRIFASGIVDTVFSRMDVFVIGKVFPIQTLGFYNRAQTLDSLIKNFAASTTTSIAFSVISKMADDLELVRVFYRRCLNVVAFLAFLLVGILFLTCFDIVIILFTDKWETVGFYFRIMAVTGFVYPLSALMVNVISARGNSKAFLKLELIKKCILFPTYLSFFLGGIYFFLVVTGIAFLAALVANAVYLEKEIAVGAKEQVWTIFKYGIIGVVGVAIVFVITRPIDNIYVHLIVSSFAFGTLYLGFCYKLKLSGFFEIYDRVLSFYNDKRYANISSAA